MAISIYEQSKMNAHKVELNSGIGEFKKSTAVKNIDKPYLTYPQVTELLTETRILFENNVNICFDTIPLLNHSNIEDPNFLNYSGNYNIPTREHTAGLASSHFQTLLTPKISGQTILGNFSFAHLEAKIAHTFFKSFHGNQAVDHFYSTQGAANIELIGDVVKAHDISKNDLVIFTIPDNGIKAFRNTKFGPWTVVETKTREATFNGGEIYQIDQSGTVLHKIKLSEEYTTNLISPIYKVKTQERWVLILPSKTDYKSINQTLKLNLSKNFVQNLQYDSNAETKTIQCSPGQAARVIYELFGANFDAIPEAMLHFEGGSWSSIVQENCSSGRHNGSNSMHEVIEQQWFLSADAAIPWNYLGFDRLTRLQQIDKDDFILALDSNIKGDLADNICFIESKQDWKKDQAKILAEQIKKTYKNYSDIGSKKYLFSNKDLLGIAAKYLANLSIHSFKQESSSYQANITKLNVPSELLSSLKNLAFLHLACSAAGDFYSSYDHPKSRLRRIWLNKILNN